MPRCPQGRPVLVQAGSSDTGRRFAARHAEAVFTAHMEKRTAQEFYADLEARWRAPKAGVPDQVLILPGLSPMIGSTEAEAKRMARELNELADPEVGRKRLSGRFGGHDFSHLPLDKPLVPEDFPDPGSVQAARSRTEVIINIVRRDKPTLRQLLAYMAGARGHFTMAGTPEQVADLIEDWFTDGAADGFNVMPPLLPNMLEVFSAEVIPILQRRGLFRTEYSGTTLRENYGLDWPKTRVRAGRGGGVTTQTPQTKGRTDMKIVDAQIHLWHQNLPGNPAHRQITSYTAEDCLKEMDAGGVDAALIHPPGWDPNSGAIAEAAAQKYPDRFAILGNFPPDKPESRDLIAGWLKRPGMLGLRWAFTQPHQQTWMTDGTMDWVWPACEKAGIPVALMASNYLPQVGADRRTPPRPQADHRPSRPGARRPGRRRLRQYRPGLRAGSLPQRGAEGDRRRGRVRASPTRSRTFTNT